MILSVYVNCFFFLVNYFILEIYTLQVKHLGFMFFVFVLLSDSARAGRELTYNFFYIHNIDYSTVFFHR